MKILDKYTYQEALQLALDSAVATDKTEQIMVVQALDRVLSSDIIVQKNLPSFNNSAMDGYAFAFGGDDKLYVSETIFAGDKPTPSLEKNSCYKIMTGAKVPSDADTIVPIEDCKEVTDEYIVLPPNIKKGASLRLKGEEQRTGSVLLKAGQRITPAHIAMLSAQGIVSIPVYAKLSIAIVSTGDEIREPWESADEDEIYNANAFGILSLLEQHGFDASYIGSIPDNLAQTTEMISSLKSYDVIITTGGVSMGDADFLDRAFVDNGMQKIFHGVMLKPGRPTMMGKMGNTFVMAMPGNPMTTMLNTMMLSLPILCKIQGRQSYHHSFINAKNTTEFKANPTKANMVLGSITQGEFTPTRAYKYGSGMITPIIESNAIAILDIGKDGAKNGETLKVVMFDGRLDADECGYVNG